MMQGRLPIAAMALAFATPAFAGEKTSPAADFASAAEVCIAALSPSADLAAKLEGAGWTEAANNAMGKRYKRKGTSVTIVASNVFGSPGCVVDGYLARRDRNSLDETIEAALSSTYGEELKVNRSAYGTGFVVGEVMSILSFEDRSGGLSTRITAMSMADDE